MEIIKISDGYAINADQIQFVSYLRQSDSSTSEATKDANENPSTPTIRIKFVGEKDELLLSGADATRLWETLTGPT